ncbi:MAG TPA: type II toxin-antitoxin system CcdA family antitoxin [Chakrabartia sp.]|jgi:antitoxin CcdA|nr:type II toxin-antitoxin system CcdA family antitoxin [Chakrabartia sp.]
MNALPPRPRRRATNITLDATLLAEAKAVGINISQACENGLTRELKAAREAQWLKENKAALEWANRWVEENGLPLEEYRMF